MSKTKSNAERQKAYRQRHLSDEGGGARINMCIKNNSKKRLERLAKFLSASQRKVLESALAKVEREILDKLPKKHHKAYYDMQVKYEDIVPVKRSPPAIANK